MESKEMKNSQKALGEVGAKLREERLRQGLKIADVAAHLRIMEFYIRNIENAVEDDLPIYTYIIAYVRSYASMLGLDADALCDELKASLSDDENQPDSSSILDKINARVRVGRVMLAVLVAGFLLYGGWYGLDSVLFGDDSSSDQAEVNLLPETPTITESDYSADVEQPITEDSSAQKLTTPPTVSPEIETAVPSAALSVDAATVTDAQAIGRVLGREITLAASAPSWIKVTRADGSEVMAKLLQAGDVYVVPSGEDLYLTAGNAGGLNVTLGGNRPITLGGWGEALVELPLDKAIIDQRY
jgi:cytoskeletal protein RodZ